MFLNKKVIRLAPLRRGYFFYFNNGLAAFVKPKGVDNTGGRIDERRPAHRQINALLALIRSL
jgi:hypothetical protein